MHSLCSFKRLNLSLEQHLQKLDIIEVFVSTVKTPPIKQVYDKNGSYNFDVYSIREFLEILQENMLMSKYALNWKVDAYMDYSESKDPRYGKQQLTIHVPPEEIDQKMKEGFSSPLTIA